MSGYNLVTNILIECYSSNGRFFVIIFEKLMKWAKYLLNARVPVGNSFHFADERHAVAKVSSADRNDYLNTTHSILDDPPCL